MALDPRNLASLLITDTCSVWMLFSAEKLFNLSVKAGVNFYITPMVLYECRRRLKPSSDEFECELVRRFESAFEKGAIKLLECKLEDLIAISSQVSSRLNSGELSCLAIAYGIRTFSVLTEDYLARRQGENRLGLRVETTPKIYSWLHYHRHVDEFDHPKILEEHEKYERRPLTKFLNEAFMKAYECRLMDGK